MLFTLNALYEDNKDQSTQKIFASNSQNYIIVLYWAKIFNIA